MPVTQALRLTSRSRPAQPPPPPTTAHQWRRSTTPLKTLGVIFGFISLHTLPGCTPPSTRVAIEVRHLADGRAADGVPYWVTSHDTRHPLSLRDILRRAPRHPPALSTDRDGRAVLTLPADRPFTLVLWLPDHGPEPALFPEPRNLPTSVDQLKPMPDPASASIPHPNHDDSTLQNFIVRARRAEQRQ
jgi:hypothetical protein